MRCVQFFVFSQQALDDVVGVIEVMEELIGLVWVEFCGGVDSGGDGGDAGADGASAADICGSIADDPDGLSGELFLEA